MSESKYTPGPWVEKRHGYPTLYESHSFVEDSHGSPICGLWMPDGADEQKANARLIAAAPELLEVARLGFHLSTYAACCHDYNERNTREWVDELRALIENFQPIAEAALAKAEGK